MRAYPSPAPLRLAATLVVALAVAGCGGSGNSESEGPTPAQGAGGGAGGKGGRSGGGSGGMTSGTGGGGGSGSATGGSGGGGPTAGSGGGTAGASGGGGSAGGSGSGGSGGASSPDGGGDVPSAPACGKAGQICCAANSCLAGAMPMVAPGEAGMTVLELKASGGDPYAYFASKDLLPIDGPDSGYITDTGTSFLFVLHENGAVETVSSGAQRQRNELTVNPGNPAIYKGMHNETMTYTWRFKLDKMNAGPTWCDIFQVKQHGTLGPAPFMALEADKSSLNLDTQRLGVVASVPLSAIMGIWVNASVTAKYSETGSLSLSLKKEDGTVLLSYNNGNINLWGAGLDFVRPKWGFYRNKAAGAGEAAIHYNDMKIIRGNAGPSCACR